MNRRPTPIDHHAATRPPTPLTVVCGDPALVRHYADTARRLPGSVVIGERDHDPGFGVAALAPVIGYRTPGCRACSTRLDLVWTLPMLLERADPPSLVVLAITGDDVLVAIRTLLAEPELEDLLELDAVLTLLDAAQLTVRRATGTLFDDRRLAEQVAVADHIVLCGLERTTAQASSALAADLEAMAGLGVVELRGGMRDAFARDVVQRRWHGVPSTPRHLSSRHDHPSRDRRLPTRLVTNLPGPVAVEPFESWLGETLAANADRLVRVQGAIRIAHSEEPICLRGTLSAASTHPLRPLCPVPVGSTIALIGFELDTSDLIGRFRATAATD